LKTLLLSQSARPDVPELLDQWVSDLENSQWNDTIQQLSRALEDNPPLVTTFGGYIAKQYVSHTRGRVHYYCAVG
jgi:hypothetical protein